MAVTQTNYSTASKDIQGVTKTVDSNTIIYNATKDLEVSVVKSVNSKPGNEFFYQGDEIIFTIVLSRTDTVNAAVNQITLTDELKAPFDIQFIAPNQPKVEISPNGGTINYDTSTRILTISGLTLNSPNSTITIKIYGNINIV